MDLNLLGLVALALAFDFLNGFHDAANSIATVVSTRVLSPRMAVVWAAFFNFVAFLVFGTHVATAIAKDVVKQDVLSIGMIFAGLVGAIVWDLITFWFGLPTSSSHALVGGMAGVSLWVVLSAHAAIGLGTLTGGWRIVHTMGSRITKLQPAGGVCAETAAAGILFYTSHAGIPVSTTHAITGAIVGVGSTHRLTAVRWGIAGRVVWAWLLTIPGSALIAAASYAVVRAFA